MALAIRLCFLVLLMALSFAAPAQRVEGTRARASGIYGAEVTVNGQGAAARNGAFARGLLQVLTRLTGDRGVNQRPGVGQELRGAAGYVAKYDYRQDEGIGPSGAPSYRTTLVMQFDQDKVDELVSTLGLPVWPQPRPKPVLWLAIDDGRGPRLVGLAQANAARSVLDQAIERGYRLGLPAGNAAEQVLVGAIWRGDTASIARASSKYSPPMQLIGKLYRAGEGWQADWIFVDNGRVLARETESGGDARRVMASGADVAANALIRRYAKAAEPVGPPGNYTVTITGINSTDDFIRVAAYLENVPVVKGLTPVRATPEGLVYELQLASGLQGLARIAAKDGVIEAAGDEGTATFRLR